MTGFLIVTHYQLAQEFLRAVELIQGPLEQFRAIGLDPDVQPEEMRASIEKALSEVDRGEGAVILVDMFGGTPSNLCMSFLEEDRVEVVTGLNLPMLVKVASLREPLPVHEIAELAREYGRRNISVASDVLTGAESDEDDA